MEESSDQMVTDDLDDAPNCYRFGVFIDGELVGTVRIHHISKDEPYGPVMKTFDDILRPRLLRGESFINPTMLAAEPYYRSPLQALPYLTLRLGLVASVYFDATSCIGVVREEHTAFYRRIFGAVQLGEPRAYPPFSVPVMLYDANCAANRQPILKRFPFFKSTPVEQRMLFAKPAKGELAPAHHPADGEILPRRRLKAARPRQAFPFPPHSNDGVARRRCRWHYGRNTANRRDGRSMRMVAAALAGDMDTFPKYLLRNAERLGDRPAMRHKDFGIWQSWTWREQLDEVRKFALGLQALGLGKGDRIAVIGANRPRLYWTFAAAQSLGAVPVPVYADAVADEMAYVLDHAGVRFAVVQDQEQVDKIRSCAGKIPALTDVIYDEPRGLAGYPSAGLHAFSAIQASRRRTSCGRSCPWRALGSRRSARRAAKTSASSSIHPARPAARKA